MTSGQESKLPFIILLPFVAIVFAFAMKSGAPTKPDMPGVVRPVAPVVMAPAPEIVAEPAATTEVPAQVAPETPAESTESWE